jgi:hypothetical protein
MNSEALFHKGQPLDFIREMGSRATVVLLSCDTIYTALSVVEYGYCCALLRCGAIYTAL